MDFLQVMEQLRQNPQLLQQLADSPDGKSLLSRMDQSRLEQAAQQGQKGNYGEMIQLLRGVMSSPDGKELLQRMAKQLRL